MNKKDKLVKEGFVKVCIPDKGCIWVHPDGRQVKLHGNTVFTLNTK